MLSSGDALVVVDVQADFLPGGSLAVPHAEEVVPVLNRYLAAFSRAGLPMVATCDWHPINHRSFVSQGGPWPPHCIAGSAGARFASTLQLPPQSTIVSKALDSQRDAYSGFEDTELEPLLRCAGITRVFIGGLATDYCVLNTVLDALRLGFKAVLLRDAIRAVDAAPGDGNRAIDQMLRKGAEAATVDTVLG